MVARAYDIAVKNADGVTIYYDFVWDATELAVTSITIPSSVESIHGGAFAGCSNLTSVTYDLNGRRVDNPSKGIYIKYGKKYVVK